jgi:hypothetical protein
MFLTRAADALLTLLVPRATAAAATSGMGAKCYCVPRRAACVNGRIVRYNYWRVTDYYGNCTVWGEACGTNLGATC